MKAFGSKTDARPLADVKTDAKTDKTKPEVKTVPTKAKTKEEFAAEEIEKALRGGK